MGEKNQNISCALHYAKIIVCFLKITLKYLNARELL